MCASRPARLIGPTVRSCLASAEHFAIRHPLRMRIEHWELTIGQIPGRIRGSGFCQVIFARALKSAQTWLRQCRRWALARVHFEISTTMLRPSTLQMRSVKRLSRPGPRIS